MRRRVVFTGILAVVLVLLYIFFSDAGDRNPEPLVVFTQLPASSSVLTAGSDIEVPDYTNARIVSLNVESPDDGPTHLTSDLYSAVSPSLSFDNHTIVFSAKENKNDPWQIWTMNLDGSHQSKVFEGDDNCHSPSFLPTGEIVFSCKVEDPASGTLYPLFKIQEDGSGMEQITYHPHRDLHTAMLYDGRIATVSQQIYPEKGDPFLMVLRPDGTKAQAFYHNKSEFHIKSAVRQARDDDLIFVQSDGRSDELVSLSYANPLLPMETFFSMKAGEIHSADILDSTRVILSTKSAIDDVFGLRVVDFNGSDALIYKDETHHSIQPVVVRRKRTPRKLPTSISKEEGSGILISQNVNHSQINVNGTPDTKYVRVEGVGNTLDEVKVAEDGSFYLRIQSDMPVRFVSLDESRAELRGPSAWVWMRTNERRACVGCHAKKEITPRNIVPMAINEEPVLITDSSRVIDEAEVQALLKMIN